METFTALLSICEWNPLVSGGFPHKRPVMQIFVFFVSLIKQLDKRSSGWWFESPRRSIYVNIMWEVVVLAELRTTFMEDTGEICFRELIIWIQQEIWNNTNKAKLNETGSIFSEWCMGKVHPFHIIQNQNVLITQPVFWVSKLFMIAFDPIELMWPRGK